MFCSATVFSTQSKHTRSTNHKYVCGSGCWFTVLSGVWCPRKPASPQSAGYPAQGRCHGNGSSPCRCAMQACGSRQEQLQHDLFAALSSRRRQSRHRRGRGSGSSANAVVPPLPTLHALSWLSGSRTNTHDTKQSWLIICWLSTYRRLWLAALARSTGRRQRWWHRTPPPPSPQSSRLIGGAPHHPPHDVVALPSLSLPPTRSWLVL